MDKQVKKGVWQFTDLLKGVSEKHRLTLGEGFTRFVNIDDLLFKCEYENPTGSIKDRSMAYQTSWLYQKGIKKAVISSSGNAAISASHYCRQAGIDLTVFVSPKINNEKLSQLKKLPVKIIISSKPVSQATIYAKDKQAYNLRQSLDENAIIGASTLAFELYGQESKIDAVFIAVSSGTSFVAVAHGYEKLNKKIPAMHCVQTEAVCPIASLFDHKYDKKPKSLADAIVAKYTPREQRIIKIIKKSRGYGWVISDREILPAHKWLNENKLLCSYEGAACLSALWKAKKTGFTYKYPVCVLSGKYYENN